MQDYDMELTMQAPVQEPERQYYFIEEAKKLIAEKSRMLGRPLTFCVTTFGCQMNARDSEKLTGILEQIGYVEAEEEQADFVIYNTCTVRENANLRVYGRLGYLHSLKKKNPHMMIGLCGCMMQEPQVVEKLKKSYSFVNLIFGTHNIYKFAELVVSALSSDRMVIDIWKDTDKSWKICQVKESFHLNLESILCLGAIISVAIVLYLMCEVGREAEIPRILFEKLSIW